MDTTTHTMPYVTNGRSRSWNYSYSYHDENQKIVATVTVDGPRTQAGIIDQITKHYNTQGWLVRVERRVDNDLSLTSQVTEHTSTGLPKTIIDSNDVVTTLTYTPRNWLKTKTITTAQGNAQTTYHYDDVGQVKSIDLPNDVTINYDYDAAHRLTDIFTNDGERIHFELDVFGNREVEQVTNSDQVVRRLVKKEFDDLGRLWKLIGIDEQASQVNSYDENNNLTTILNANLKEIKQSFDGLNRLETVTDRKQGVITYTYDEQGNLETVEDQEALVTSYKVDGFGRRIEQISPDTGKTIYYYDLADNLVKTQDERGVVVDYTYDALNRIKTVAYPASPLENITYVYDETLTDGHKNFGRGRLTSITEANGNETQYIYNELGLLVQDKRKIGAKDYTTGYKFDLAGIVTEITYPSGRGVKYSLDTNGRVSKIQTKETSKAKWRDVVSNVLYEPFGPVRAFTYGNGLT